MFRLPCGLWGWRGTALVLLALLAPLVTLLTIVHAGTTPETATAARTVFLGSATLAAAALLQTHGRLAINAQSEWLSIALGISALGALTRGGYALTNPDAGGQHETILMAVILCLMLALVGMIGLATRSVRINPWSVGLPLAGLFLVVQQVAITRGPTLDPRLVPVLGTALLFALLGFAVAVLHLAALPVWARNRFAATVVLAGLSALIGLPSHLDPMRALVSLALGLVAGAMLANTAAALLRLVINQEQEHLDNLRVRLATVEATQRADLARLHEITTLVAGIASATRLADQLPKSAEREHLKLLVEAELDRLQRLLRDRSELPTAVRGAHPAPTSGQIDLGELVERIAVLHRARGFRVTTGVCDVRLPGDPDAVAEILDALVENAAFHGSPDDITIGVTRVPGGVEVAVTDRGPGVTPLLQNQLFRWGVHRPASPGRGIGLYSAHARALELGGSLRLDHAVPGARFVLHLPAAPFEATTPHAHPTPVPVSTLAREGVEVRDRFAIAAG